MEKGRLHPALAQHVASHFPTRRDDHLLEPGLVTHCRHLLFPSRCPASRLRRRSLQVPLRSRQPGRAADTRQNPTSSPLSECPVATTESSDEPFGLLCVGDAYLAVREAL